MDESMESLDYLRGSRSDSETPESSKLGEPISKCLFGTCKTIEQISALQKYCKQGRIYLVTIRKTKNPNDVFPNDLNMIAESLKQRYFNSYDYCKQYEIHEKRSSLHLHGIFFLPSKISYKEIQKMFVGYHVHLKKLFSINDFQNAHYYVHKQDQEVVFNKFWLHYFSIYQFQ